MRNIDLKSKILILRVWEKINEIRSNLSAVMIIENIAKKKNIYLNFEKKDWYIKKKQKLAKNLSNSPNSENQYESLIRNKEKENPNNRYFIFSLSSS